MTASLNKFALMAIMFIPFTLSGQNALDFDGLDDQIVTPNASSLISGTDISMAFWVYPTNPNPGYPDFDGIAGFRNDTDADFYILHLNTSTVECRFKNSAGTLFEILYNGFLLNEWNHLAQTYDGSWLRVYHNGVIVDSVTANGYIFNISESFNIGFLPFNNPDFFLDGRMDDVCLYSKALSDAEVFSLYNDCSVDLSDPDLELCYEFNQGTPGGNNSGITTAFNSAGIPGSWPGSMTNFALNGTMSNFIAWGKNTTSAITESVCQSYTSPSGNYTWTISGTYLDTIPNSINCDSIIVIDLTVDTVDVSVLQVGINLQANAPATSASYQWLDCDNGFAVIPGDTSQLFTAAVNGNYAVQVTQNGCVDTSACYNVNSVGISESSLSTVISYYPNPVTGLLNIELGAFKDQVMVMITDVTGKQVGYFDYRNTDRIALEIGRTPGVYLLEVRAADETARFRIIK